MKLTSSLNNIDPEALLRSTVAFFDESIHRKISILQGLYAEMKFEKPSRIQAVTLPMVLQPPYRSLIAQV